MKRIPYVEFLDSMRDRERERLRAPRLLEATRIAPKRERTERVKFRLSPARKAFLEWACASSHDGSLRRSEVVSVALALLEELDIPWDTVASKNDLVSAVRRRLEERK